jgi:site-specific DNA-methyltransferase (adenine-specific)
VSDFWLYQGDCVEVLRSWPEASVDAVVCDPPYEIGFMAKGWDQAGVAFAPATWAEVLRVLKPGGHLLSFGGTRTYHRLACAIEDAGFEVRDSIHWIYGSGFPKSKNVALSIDKGEGHPNRGRAIPTASTHLPGGKYADEKLTSNPVEPYTAKSPEAKAWEGWGTALKPAHEPIILARKPLDGTVAANVQKWGTGALNIDGCRIPTTDKLAAGGPLGVNAGDTRTGKALGMFQEGTANTFEQHSGGRWPANVMFDEAAAVDLDARAAGVSRFFYVAKPSRRERDHGLDAFPARTGGEATDREDGTAGLSSPRAGAGRTGGSRNYHPTVKPVALMRELCRLVTPPRGIVLDPFVGSGSTGMAARLEGFRFVGVDQSAEYLALAQARIEAALTLK